MSEKSEFIISPEDKDKIQPSLNNFFLSLNASFEKYGIDNVTIALAEKISKF